MNNPATIIVIEDEAHIRRFLRTTLSSEGYKVIEAETGKQCLTEAETRKPDLIVLDLGLPDMDGVDVIKELRTWSFVPVIIPVSYTHLRAHETRHDLVCRLL